jgi:hypothetical protein
MNDPLITADEVATLNAARTLLKTLEKRAETLAWDEPASMARSLGRFAEGSDVAGHSLFNLLNCANSYCDVALTPEQLHNRTLEPVA